MKVIAVKMDFYIGYLVVFYFKINSSTINTLLIIVQKVFKGNYV